MPLVVLITASRNADAPPPADTEAPIPAAEVQSVPDNVSSAAQGEGAPTPVSLGDVPAAPEATYESRMAELEADAGKLLSRGDRKVWQSEVANSQRILQNLNEQLASILNEQPSGSGKALSTARQDKQARLRAVDQQIEQVQKRLQDANNTLAPNMPCGQFYEARADLSRIQQGIIPESMRGTVRETEIKPSDIDAAHTLNEGLYYDIESAPVLHASNESINSHVAAMDEAYRQLNDGQPVNIGMMARGLDGPARRACWNLQASSTMQCSRFSKRMVSGMKRRQNWQEKHRLRAQKVHLRQPTKLAGRSVLILTPAVRFHQTVTT